MLGEPSFVLVGLPASGKSTIARGVAQALGCDCVDTDLLVQEQCGKSIADVFEEDGEHVFRDCETSALTAALASTRSIIATGGGVVVRPQNRELLRTSGRVTYLLAYPRALMSRLKQDGKRPLLNTADPMQTLERLFDERHPLYREVAHCVFRTQHQPLRKTIDALLQEWRSLGWI